jgi:hypothetical protein
MEALPFPLSSRPERRGTLFLFSSHADTEPLRAFRASNELAGAKARIILAEYGTTKVVP